MSRKYFIKTFGCQMNQADSEKINMILMQSGFVRINEIKDADLVILNTCSVRKKGEDRVFSMINSIIKDRKNGLNKTIVGITGCMVRKTGLNKSFLEGDVIRSKAKKIDYIKNENGIFNNDDGLFPIIDGLDFTLRIEETKYIPFILSHITGENIGKDDKFDDYLKSKQLRENPFSASIIIQSGCDNFCSFCIVPYTRGKEISRPIIDIIEEAKKAVAGGAKEITLVGQNVNSYGKQFVDKKLWNNEKSKWEDPFLSKKNHPQPLLSKEGGFRSPFRELLNELNEIKGLDRVRFTSSNPHDMTSDILSSHFELNNTCNYLHFALQSGSNKLLKKMNRKHNYEDFKKQVEYLRGKDPFFSISTDIIVGYSGETDEMFKETVKAFKEIEFDFAYNARYSVRKGTIASKLYPDDISPSVKAERWHILNNLLLESVTKRNKMMIGRFEEILISGEKDNQFYGRTRNFKEVFFDKIDKLKVGDIVRVEITGIDKWVLKGDVV